MVTKIQIIFQEIEERYKNITKSSRSGNAAFADMMQERQSRLAATAFLPAKRGYGMKAAGVSPRSLTIFRVLSQ